MDIQHNLSVMPCGSNAFGSEEDITNRAGNKLGQAAKL